MNAETIKRLFFGVSPTASNPFSGGGSALLDAAAAEWKPMEEDVGERATPPPALGLDASSSSLFCALVGAAVDVIWRARAPSASSAKLVFTSGGARDGRLLERAAVLEVSSRRDLALALCARSSSFFGDGVGGGLALIIFSVIWSRGLDGIAADADAPSPPLLHARFGYASQELVHLFILGRAVSHCVDGTVDAGGVLLRGAPSRSDVGFLSVHAALGLQDVGTHLCCPRASVFVVYGESHYSVLFAAPEGTVWPPAPPLRRTFGVRPREPPRAPAPERCRGNALAAGDVGESAFDIVYWDGLAKQDYVVRLTVEGTAGHAPVHAHGSRRLDAEKSALELWVINRWGVSATINWNNNEAWEPMSILDAKDKATLR
jgi:hypothetical protein